MTSPVPETKKNSKLLSLAAVCFAVCVILLGVNLVLPLVFRAMGLSLTVSVTGIILFAVESASLAVLVIALLKNNTGLLLSVPAFVLAGAYICGAADSVVTVIKQVIYINELTESGAVFSDPPVMLLSITLTGAYAALLCAAAFVLLGGICMRKQKQNNLNAFVRFVPTIAMGVSVFINALLILAQVINTVIALTEGYPRLATISTLYSLSVKSIVFTVYLLYTVATVLIGIYFTKKSAD